MKRLFLSLSVLAVAGCGGSAPPADAGAPACSVRFTGNYQDSVVSDAPCARLVDQRGSQAQGWVLELNAASPVAGATTRVQIDLGASPAPGSYTAASVSSWSAVAVGSTNCEYSAGSNAIPSGGFTLRLDSISSIDESAELHGALSLVQHVAAPPGVDCGQGDAEQVDFEF